MLFLTTLAGVADAATGLERQRDQLAGMLEPAAATLRSAAASADHAGTSLTSSAAAAGEGAALTAQLGSALDELSALSGFDVLGARPFAQAVASFADVAARSRAVSANLDATAQALGTDVADSVSVAANLNRLADQLDALRASLGAGSKAGDVHGLSATTSFDIARIVLVALLAWLAIPAATCIWLGWRLWRPRIGQSAPSEGP
jgi:ABC-type transporter Mla subunit MlaD